MEKNKWNADEKVFQAFEKLRVENKEFHGNRFIESATPTMYNGIYDCKGVDGILVFTSGEKLFIQIKNRRNEKLKAKYEKRGICFVGILKYETGEIVPEKTFSSVNIFLGQHPENIILPNVILKQDALVGNKNNL